VGNAIIPQLFFFTVLFTILIVFFSFKAIFSSDYKPYLVGSSVALVGLLWYQTLVLWNRLVTESTKDSNNP
jgi:hypothetical protein